MVTALVIGVFVALIVAAGWWIAQARLNEDARLPEEPLPLFSSRADDGSPGARQHPGIEPAEVAMLRRPPVQPAPHAPAMPHVPTPSSRPFDVDTAAPTPTARQESVRPEAPPAPSRNGGGNGRSSAGALPPLPFAESAAMVPVPAGTVQFLPGRLEVLQGRGVAGQELRFIRPDNPAERPSVTFGRGEGPPYRHVQLRAPTVSRLHARIVLLDGGVWTLENLSTTNPIVLNGAELVAGSSPAPLADGDRIEMGEIVFRYRDR